MPPVKWILYKEKVVGKGSPRYVDVDNRPLRQVLELHGWDPDDAGFEGLHHFPAGVYTDNIYEETPGAGITINGDVIFNAGSVTFASSLMNNLEIGAVPVGEIFVPFNYAGYQPKNASLTVNSDAYIRQVVLGSSLGHGINLDARGKWMPQVIKTTPFLSIGIVDVAGDTVLNKEELMNWLHPYVTSWCFNYHSITAGADLTAVAMSHQYLDYATAAPASGTLGVGKWRIYEEVTLDRKVILEDGIYGDVTGTITKLVDHIGDTGWTAGTGGSTKGGLNASTATTAQVAAVVNAIVDALMTHHGLLRT